MTRRCGRTALLLDGAYVIERWQREKGYFPDASDVVNLATELMAGFSEADLYRIFFYTADPYDGSHDGPLGRGPVLFADTKTYRNNEQLLARLEEWENIAVRRGELVFRGWRLGDSATRGLQRDPNHDIGPKDFVADLVQKGVDMRIGLDIAAIALKRLVGTVVLVAGDADMVPALRLARREGLRVGLCSSGFAGIRRGLRAHADFMVDWSPAASADPGEDGPASPASPR